MILPPAVNWGHWAFLPLKPRTDELDLTGIVDMFEHLTQIAHVEPLPACWAFHVVVGLCPSDAVDVLTRFRPLQRL
jgi:hypothetical protein